MTLTVVEKVRRLFEKSVISSKYGNYIILVYTHSVILVI